jgi:hypothetical protein
LCGLRPGKPAFTKTFPPLRQAQGYGLAGHARRRLPRRSSQITSEDGRVSAHSFHKMIEQEVLRSIFPTCTSTPAPLPCWFCPCFF